MNDGRNTRCDMENMKQGHGSGQYSSPYLRTAGLAAVEHDSPDSIILCGNRIHSGSGRAHHHRRLTSYNHGSVSQTTAKGHS